MSKLNKQIAELTKSKKKQELLLNMPIKCDSTTNTEDLRSKLNGESDDKAALTNRKARDIRIKTIPLSSLCFGSLS